MKKIIDDCMKMVYPALISFFIFCFVEAFVKGSLLEPLQLVSAILSITFGLIFIVGFVWNIIMFRKSKE